MKELTNIQRVQNYLVKVTKYILEEYNLMNEIGMPTVTIQSTPKAYTHCSLRKVWIAENTASYEINVSSNYLNRSIVEIVASLKHELSHRIAMERGLKDVSANGFYHTKVFKDIAESTFELQIDKHPQYGFTLTSPTDETLDFCIKYQLEDIKIYRALDYTASVGGHSGNRGTAPTTNTPTTIKPKSSVRKYKCPQCGASCRATKAINIICGDCMVPFELVKTY